MYAMLGTRPDLAYPVGLLGENASAIHPSHTGRECFQSSSISSTRAILGLPTRGDANNLMATAMRILPPMMSIDVESPVAMSSGYGEELSAGNQRSRRDAFVHSVKVLTSLVLSYASIISHNSGAPTDISVGAT